MTNGKMFKRKLARQLGFINVLVEGITESLVGKGFLFRVVTSNAWNMPTALLLMLGHLGLLVLTV